MVDKAVIRTIAENIDSLMGQRTEEAVDKRMLASSEFLRVARGRLEETRQILSDLFEEGIITQHTQLWLNDRINEVSYLD